MSNGQCVFGRSRNNKLSIFKYAYENGCPYEKHQCLECATINRSNDILEYIHEIERQRNKKTIEMF